LLKQKFTLTNDVHVFGLLAVHADIISEEDSKEHAERQAADAPAATVEPGATVQVHTNNTFGWYFQPTVAHASMGSELDSHALKRHGALVHTLGQAQACRQRALRLHRAFNSGSIIWQASLSTPSPFLFFS
jgi:hypothetical protein